MLMICQQLKTSDNENIMSVKTRSPIWGASFFESDQIGTGWDSRCEVILTIFTRQPLQLPTCLTTSKLTLRFQFNFCTLQYDLYQKLQLQFYVPLMIGEMDARNMQSNLAVNKYLHTVASCWISSTQNYDARNSKYKKTQSLCYLHAFAQSLF